MSVLRLLIHVTAALAIFAVAGTVMQGQQEQATDRSSQQELNYLQRQIDCKRLVGTDKAPMREDAVAGVLSDEFVTAAKQALDSLEQLRQHVRVDYQFFDLADNSNGKLTPLPQEVHYFPDAIVCGFLADQYAYIIKARIHRDPDAKVRAAETARNSTCALLLKTILEAKDILASGQTYVYAPCTDALRNVTKALREEQLRNPHQITQRN